MPIHKMNFEGGVFFAKQVGYLDNVDARMWANALGNYARSSDVPIVAIIDACEVDRLCPTIPKVFAETLKLSNLNGIAIAIGDLMTSHKARVIGALSEISGVRVFPTVEEARRYANARLRTPSSGFPAMHFSFAWVG